MLVTNAFFTAVHGLFILPVVKYLTQKNTFFTAIEVIQVSLHQCH